MTEADLRNKTHKKTTKKKKKIKRKRNKKGKVAWATSLIRATIAIIISS